ncbi:carbohydrate-binding module family 43 protein/Glycoside hydrolase family 72 protein [Infundibulicybe gibba]|nr:carbohydrate-binding module family 43 protein/Glycoside hydrolase family 72 protein [Infundibulicybe gibba]
MRNAAAFAVVLVAFFTSVNAIAKVSRAGRYLYTDDGTRFYIKGVAYQQQGTVVQSADNSFGEPSSFTDPLSLGDACARDLPFLQQLTVNTLRVYSVDSSLNHDSCMNAFSNAGIYTIIDLALPLNGSIDRNSPSWSTNLLDQYIKTIDAFSKYDNVLAFNVGNEAVVQNSTAAAPFVKAAARDIKAYLASKSSTTLVGYSAINGAGNFRDPLANYLTCDPSNGNSGATAIDLYGLNDYEWCGASSFQAAYAGTTGDFAGFNVPAYFSEFGCVDPGPRLWTEPTAIFSTDMSPVWSGGIAFSYFPASSAAGEFGMVTISADNKTVTTSDDFNRLVNNYSNVTSPPNTPSQSAAGASTYPSCPTANDTFVASTNIPPTPNEAACNCLLSTLSCRFTPATANYSVVVGTLLDQACGLLGGKGGTCADIGSNGQTGVYGRLSGCDPTIKLSYVMSLFYEANNRDEQACSFAGNGTVNPLAPTSPTAADAAASSCVSSPSATFVPSAVASGGGSSPSSTGGQGTNNGGTSGGTSGVPTIIPSDTLVAITSVAAISLLSAFWAVM